MKFLVLLMALQAFGSLKKDMERPENFPAYLYRYENGTQFHVGRYVVGGKEPTGPMECEHIKLYNQRSERPLTWEERNTAASNVYYHVHRAIDYFNWLSSRVGEKINQETKTVAVRVNMDVDWAMWIKFSEQHRYNTSQTLPDADPDKWGTPDEEREIWFYQPKRAYLPKYAPTTWIPGLRDTFLGTAGFPLDTARVPTIVYHEWVHLMTRPYFGILRDNVLNEGYSDYYGSVIGGRPEMGDTQEFSTFPYHHYYDESPYPAKAKDYKTPGTFVPKLFWTLRRRHGGERVDVLLWKTLKFLNAESTLADLPGAIEKAAADVGFAPDERKVMKQRFDYLFRRGKYAGRKGS